MLKTEAVAGTPIANQIFGLRSTLQLLDLFTTSASMESSHPLKALLQLQLASDSSSVLHLPHVLSVLTPEYFLPSPHLIQWTARINSLLHSKDPGSRWAGLCIAQKTSIFSKSTMIENAQSWLGVALPMLSVCVFTSTPLVNYLILCN